MGLLIFLQVIFDLAFIATATLLLIDRSKQRTMEDPRMSRGLQLLSNKIAILQDLMDRSDATGRHLTQLIDGKQRSIQERIEEVEVHLGKIHQATEKSKEVAQIFQDKIPHKEFIERQKTVNYTQAAKLANQGFSLEDISRQVDLPRGELELIAKINRHRIITKEPSWIIEKKAAVAVEPTIVKPEIVKEKVKPVIFKKISMPTVDEIEIK